MGAVPFGFLLNLNWFKEKVRVRTFVCVRVCVGTPQKKELK